MFEKINLILQKIVIDLINKRNREKADEEFFANILKELK